MGWQDAPIVKPGVPSVQPAWMSAPIAPAPASAPASDPIGEANKAANASEHGPVQDVIDMIRGAPEGIVPALKGLVSSINPTEMMGNTASLVGKIRDLIANPQAALSAVKNATPAQVGKNVLAPAIVGAGVNEAGGLAAGASDATGAAAAEAATPYGQLGLRTTKPHPIAASAAGPTAGPTLDAQNRAAATTVLGADAGVPHDVPVNPTSLEAARAAPGRLLDQGAAALPTSPLSPAAAQKVAAARGPSTITKPTPNVAAQIDDIEKRMLAPGAQFTGEEIRATRNSLSSDANSGMNSTDADTRTIAKYKRGIVDALDQHVADTMPPNSAISPDMIENARSTLAKNYNLQDLIGKGGDVDLQALAADHRANPNKFTGPTRTVAQFASDHPEVTGSATDAERIAPPGLAADIAHINVLNPRSWIQPLVGGAGRRVLRGPAGASLEAAQQTPVAGLGGEFEPKPLTSLSPPPGRAFTPNQTPLAGSNVHPPGFDLTQPPGRAFTPNQPDLATGTPQRDFFGTGANNFTASHPTAPPAAAAGPPGQIRLADLLSHGVEQQPAPGLSSGPMGAPVPQGVPFARNAAHEAGDLSLDEGLNGPFKGQPMSMADFASVKSQGVPDGTMQRSRPSSAPEFADLGRANNASGESAASLEAQSRLGQEKAAGVQPVIFGDSGITPLLHDVTAVDRAPPKGHIILDANTSKVINGGGLKPAAVQALVNRFKAQQLGDAF